MILQGFSTGELMRLVVLVALNLILFQGIWWFVVVPPIALLAIVLNLVLHAVWVRRRRLTRAEVAAGFAGLCAVVATFIYEADVVAGRRGPRLVGHLLAALPQGLADRLRVSFPRVLGLWNLEYAILIGLGLLAMLSAAGLARRLGRPGETLATTPPPPSP